MLYRKSAATWKSGSHNRSSLWGGVGLAVPSQQVTPPLFGRPTRASSPGWTGERRLGHVPDRRGRTSRQGISCRRDAEFGLRLQSYRGIQRWITDAEFLDRLAAASLIPGPRILE